MSNLTPLQPVSFGVGGDVRRHFFYSTTDTEAAVIAPGYITQSKIPLASVDDVIEINGAGFTAKLRFTSQQADQSWILMATGGATGAAVDPQVAINTAAISALQADIDGAEPWAPATDYKAGELFTHDVTQTTAVDINGAAIAQGLGVFVYPTAQTSGASVTLAEIAKWESAAPAGTVEDVLTSVSTENALSAAQGKVLKDEQDLQTLSLGQGAGNSDMGAYTGATVSTAGSAKGNIQELETAVEIRGHNYNISRGDAVTGVSPTAIETPDLPLVASATVGLTSGVVEFWQYSAATWTVIYTQTPVVLDGNNYNLSRADAVQAVAPTAGEVATPLDGDTATVFLTDGVREYYSHNGTAWSLNVTVDVYVPNGSQEYTRTSSFSASVLDGRVQTVYNFTGTAASNVQVGADTSAQGDGNTTSVLVKNNGTANLTVAAVASLTGDYTGPSTVGQGQGLLISYEAGGLSATGYLQLQNAVGGLVNRGKLTATLSPALPDSIYELDAETTGPFDFVLPATTGTNGLIMLVPTTVHSGAAVTVKVQTGESLMSAVDGTLVIETPRYTWLFTDTSGGWEASRVITGTRVVTMAKPGGTINFPAGQTFELGVYTMTSDAILNQPNGLVVGETVMAALTANGGDFKISLGALGYTGNDGKAIGDVTIPDGTTRVFNIYKEANNEFVITNYTSPTVSVIIDASGAPVAQTLPTATGSGTILNFVTSDITNPAALVLNVIGEQINGVVDATFLLSDYPVGTQFQATDKALGQWSVAPILESVVVSNGVKSTQVETLVYTPNAVPVAGQYTHDNVETIAGTGVTLGNIYVKRSLLANGQATVRFDCNPTYFLEDEPVVITLPAGYMTEPHNGNVWRDELDVTAEVLISGGVDSITVDRDNDISGVSPLAFWFEGVGDWQGAEPNTAVIDGAFEIQDQAASGYVDIGTMRMQWGKAVGQSTVTLPVPFADTTYSLTHTIDYPSFSTTQSGSVITVSRTTTSFTPQASLLAPGPTLSNLPFDWIAIGIKP